MATSTGLRSDNESRLFLNHIGNSFADKVFAPLERQAKAKGCSPALRSLSAARALLPVERWNADKTFERLQHVADARRALAGLPSRPATPTQGLPIDGSGNVWDITLYGHLGDDRDGGIGGQAIAAAICRFSPSAEIRVHVNSPGGTAVDGQRIYDALRAHQGRVVTHCDGLALSAAATIFQAGDRRVMASNSVLMVHDAVVPVGASSAVRAFAKDLNDNIARIHASRSKLSLVEARDAMKAETWYSAADAKRLGLIDEIGPPTHIGSHANFDAYGYRNVPQFITDTKAKLEKFRLFRQIRG